LSARFFAFSFPGPREESRGRPEVCPGPGDGRIIELAEEPHPYFGAKTQVIRIFLSIFDVHVQHSPISGTVTRTEYKEGKFLDARDPKAAHENESNSIYIENAHTKVVVKQIAGLVARRIACKVRRGDIVRVGQRLGLIRFGSQVDLYLPPEVEVCVALGDRVVSGVSVVAMNKKLMAQKSVQSPKSDVQSRDLGPGTSDLGPK